ncbi:hypothetical protein D9V87_03625 [Bacteroidetes/Chlorobi group bacterium MS-B_bin-24]|nr:MAG: hypothetical protein D9V87_03625 [Bacteroidetes/Chlorobi group bacterium MS-B_bin-24]
MNHLGRNSKNAETKQIYHKSFWFHLRAKLLGQSSILAFEGWVFPAFFFAFFKLSSKNRQEKRVRILPACMFNNNKLKEVLCPKTQLFSKA